MILPPIRPLLPVLLLLATLAGCTPKPSEQIAGTWKLLPPEPPELLRKFDADSLSAPQQAMRQHWQRFTEQQLELRPDGTYLIRTGDPPRTAARGSWRVQQQSAGGQEAAHFLVLAKGDDETRRRLRILALSAQRVRLQDPGTREQFRLVPVQ